MRCLPGELEEVHEPAFVEPLPGIKPSETVKVGDISTDKLGKKDLKGSGDLKTRKGPVDLQAASSSGQLACEQLKKTKPVKGKTPGAM